VIAVRAKLGLFPQDGNAVRTVIDIAKKNLEDVIPNSSEVTAKNPSKKLTLSSKYPRL